MSLFGGGGFGSSTQQQQLPATSSPFGQSSQQQQVQPSTGGLFGGVQTASPFAPAASTGAFGQTQSQQPQQNGTTGGSLFGGSTLGGGNSLFGGQQQQNQQQNAGFSFNQSTNQQQGSSLFGQQQQQQRPQQGGSLFGLNQQSSMSGSFMVGSGGMQQSVGSYNSSQQSNSVSALQRIASAWDVSDLNSHFQTYLYNQADNEIIASAYQAGPNEDKVKFDAAVRRKPNPK